MNMQIASPRPSDEVPWARIATEVNAWRGACLQSFAQAEAAVTEALLFLSNVDQHGPAVQLRHLVEQRFEDLAQAIGPEGGFAAEGCAAHDALVRFRTHERLRAHLAHDVARIAVERNGTWVVILRHLSIRSGNAERGTVAFEQAEAAEVLSEMKRKAQQLDAALDKLRRNIELKLAG